MARSTTALEYLDELISYGGFWIPRWRMIADLQDTAKINFPNDRRTQMLSVNMYQAGHAQYRNLIKPPVGQEDQSELFLAASKG